MGLLAEILDLEVVGFELGSPAGAEVIQCAQGALEPHLCPPDVPDIGHDGQLLPYLGLYYHLVGFVSEA